jgi:predicted proteasome-type protease
MIYEVTQTTEKKRLLFGTKKVNKVYKFNTLNKALIFCLNEQIKIITVNIGKGITTTRKPFWIYYSLEQFIKVSKKNPFFYLGVHDYKKVDIERIYFYLVQNNLSKLKKFK